jgi:hypothetical protein
MWLLLIIFLNPPIMTQQALQRFDTAQECQKERNRIGYEMAAAYPWTHDFDIVCRYQAAHFNQRRI